MKDRISQVFFLVLVLGGGLTIGYFTAPGDWYAGLNKPSFNPPGWIFGPVWTVLYIMIAAVGWRAWRQWREGRSNLLIRLWGLQLGLNFLWSPAFFLAHQIGWAFAIIVALLATILWFIAASWSRDATAAWLFVPYAAWVAFASVLNGMILWLN